MCQGHCIHHDITGIPAFLSYVCCLCGQRGSEAWADKHPPEGKGPHGIHMPYRAVRDTEKPKEQAHAHERRAARGQ